MPHRMTWTGLLAHSAPSSEFQSKKSSVDALVQIGLDWPDEEKSGSHSARLTSSNLSMDTVGRGKEREGRDRNQATRKPPPERLPLAEHAFVLDSPRWNTIATPKRPSSP